MERHRFDPLSFVFGVVFVGFAVLGLTDTLTLSATDLRWLGPALFVLLGLVLVITAGRGRDRDDEAVPASVASPDEPTAGPSTSSDDRDDAPA